MSSETESPVPSNEIKFTRGKRRLANWMFAFLFAMTLAGLWSGDETTVAMAKFYTPFIFSFAGAMYIGDGYFANQRLLGSGRSSTGGY